jgi:hypothetical protein
MRVSALGRNYIVKKWNKQALVEQPHHCVIAIPETYRDNAPRELGVIVTQFHGLIPPSLHFLFFLFKNSKGSILFLRRYESRENGVRSSEPSLLSLKISKY